MAYDPYRYWNARKDPNRPGAAPDWLIARIAGFVEGAETVFELGPGVGRTFEAYRAGQHIVTLDLSRLYGPAVQQRAADRGLTVSQHYLESVEAGFPFPDAAFDTGICVQVLMHVPPRHVGHTLGELARICRRTLVVSSLNPAWEGRVAHCFNHDYEALCRQAGCVAAETVRTGETLGFVLGR